MESQKTILWVEDFANDFDLLPDEYDPLREIMPDRTEQIKELFPPYLVDKVQVLEDPTKLPEHMKQYGKNYEFIILDINFENGISQFPEDIDMFAEEMRTAHINLPSMTLPTTVKKLGYYLYLYLIAKWQVQTENIVFFSAYCDEDTVSGFRNRELRWVIEPLFFDKKDSIKMGEYLSKRFSPDQITDEAAIVRAKMLYRFWKEKGIPNDSILQKVRKPKSGSLISESDIIQRIGRVLDETNPGSGQEAYDKVLHEVTFAFEGEINYNAEELWHKKVYEVLKCLRNPYAHRSTTNSGLSAIEFLLIFAVALRAIFESTSQPVNDLLESEKWLVDGLEQIVARKEGVSRLNAVQLNVRTEETMLQWYLGLQSKVHFIGDGNSMLYSPTFKYQYTLKNVVQLFCMRAMNAVFYFNPMIMSSFPEDQRYPDNGPKTTISPNIRCQFQSCDNPKRKKSSSVPKVMESLARAYIHSQLEYEMKRSYPFEIYP